MESNALKPGERIFHEMRTASFRKEEYTYIHTGIIDADGEMWTTTEMDEANIFQVYNQYRHRHGIPFPDEIAAIRRHYGLSAAKMAQILGFGINQYRMYEDGEVPSVSNARTIIAAREKDVFMNFVEASKSEMSEAEYIRVKRKVVEAPGDLTLDEYPSEYTGYRTELLDKIANVLELIISKIGSTFVTKMNKLLFYVDFIHYKNHGFGITGLTYRAFPFGPVPQSWATLYGSLPSIAMEEHLYAGGHSGIKLETVANTLICLEASELSTIERICALFGDKNAGEISAISHQEKGWLDNHETRGAISYQNAFELNY